MNRNAVLNMDHLIEDHSYLQYFQTDPYMQTNNNEHMPIIQHGDNNASHNSTHYMSTNKPTANNNKPQHTNSSMNQSPYPININSSLSPMSGSMLHPAQIHVPQPSGIDQNTMNNSHQQQQQQQQQQQARFCKSTSSTTASINHFETSPLAATYHTQPTGIVQNHHSPSLNRPAELNHFNESISTTLTHISETDNSHNNYVTTPQQQQQQRQPPMAKHSNIGKNINMISTPQNYSSMSCHLSANDWSTLPSHISNPTNSQRLKNSDTNTNNQMNTYNMQQQNEHRFSYLESRNPEYHSITSTPMSSQPQTQNNESYLMKTNMNHTNNDAIIQQKKNDKNSTGLVQQDCKNKTKAILNLEDNETMESGSSPMKKVFEKRHVIVFKIVEQLIDPETKNIIKENVTKNEEILISSGLTSLNEWNRNSTISNSSFSRSHVGSSGLLADVSSLSTNSKNLTNHSSPSSQMIYHSKNFSKTNEPESVQSSSVAGSRKSNNNNVNLGNNVKRTGNKGKSQNETENIINEDKERGAASALLSLQIAANTPVKKSVEPNISDANSVPSPKLTATNSNDYDSHKDNRDDNEQALYAERLKPGIKIMAKWKDKNFYPAETVKQHEIYRWMVRFEDMATRNLFESEIVRVEHLAKQEVMVKISEELCKSSSVKKIIKTDEKNYEFDLEHTDEDEKSKVIKRYPLKDIFLYAEQGTNILNKFPKPNIIGAVFADVDFNNIIFGKRARSVIKPNGTKTESISNKKSSSSLDNETTSNNKKRKAMEFNENNSKSNNENININRHNKNNISSKNLSKALNNSFQMIGHYHENSLSLSPSPTKTSKSIESTIPKNELEKIFGPIPRSGSKIFHNICFILTCGNYNNNNNLFESDDSNPECSTPFDKSYLTKQIINGNGKVYDSFEEMKKSNNGSDCICIADTYSRSIKFIQCLAAGVSIVSHQWIIECCRQNRTLDRNSYILPAGYSIITNALSSDKSTFKKSSVLFKGVKFYFGSEFPEKLHQLWSPVLFAAQAMIVSHDSNIHKSLQRGQVDIIIGDASCSNQIINKAKQMKIPVVSSEYIVQCLINGRKLPYDASPSFSYMNKI